MTITKQNLGLIAGLIAIFGLVAFTAYAAVTVNSGPTSLLTSATTAPASSGQIALFSVTLTENAGETLSSIDVVVHDNGSSGVTTGDLASVSVYKDDGDGVFESAADALAGTNATVNVGATTTVATGSNNTLTGVKFFVSIATSASWSDASPADSITVTLPANAITTSENSPATSAVTTSAITADTTGPVLNSAVASDTGGANGKNAGDSIKLTFSEGTNKPAVTKSNIASILTLNNSHSFLDGAGEIGSTVWSSDGTMLTITLSASSTLPSVAIGDILTIATPSVIKDAHGNGATGNKVITGTFGTAGNNDDDDEEEDDDFIKNCGNELRNGKLYRIEGEQTVYLAAACRLKPFRGAAVFHARGHKFQNIIQLESLPSNVTISDKPALPAGGTLIKGSDATVWFVTNNGRRKGFRSANAFLRLGFAWNQIQQITDQDLNTMSEDEPIEENSDHPDGSLIKCSNSPTVFEIDRGKRKGFRSANAFLERGHSWEHISQIDCGLFAYLNGQEIEE